MLVANLRMRLRMDEGGALNPIILNIVVVVHVVLMMRFVRLREPPIKYVGLKLFMVDALVRLEFHI